MPLARKITKATYDSLTGNNEYQKKVYVVDPKDANSYILDAEPDQDLTNALSAKQHEIDSHNTTKGKLTQAETDRDKFKVQVDTLETEKRQGWNKNPDRDRIEAELRDQVKAEKEGRKSDEAAANKRFSDHVRNATAEQMATEISTAPSLLKGAIADMLHVEFTDTGHIVRVLKEGKPSSQSLAELKAALVANPEYKSIMKASDASGGGAGSNGKPNNGSGAKAFKDLSEQERTQLYRENPTEFTRQSDAARAEALKPRAA